MIFSLKSRQELIESNSIMDDETRTLIGRIRNGVETTPSVIRNKYGVDKMPVRDKIHGREGKMQSISASIRQGTECLSAYRRSQSVQT